MPTLTVQGHEADLLALEWMKELRELQAQFAKVSDRPSGDALGSRLSAKLNDFRTLIAAHPDLTDAERDDIRRDLRTPEHYLVGKEAPRIPKVQRTNVGQRVWSQASNEIPNNPLIVPAEDLGQTRTTDKASGIGGTLYFTLAAAEALFAGRIEAWDRDPKRPHVRVKRDEWLARAMMLRKGHLDWSDARIAQEVDIGPAQLSRSEEYQALKRLVQQRGGRVPRGHVIIDPESDRRDVEAYDDSDPD